MDSFIQEIQDRKRREIEQLDAALDKKRARLQEERDSAIKQISAKYSNETKIRSEKETARIIEEARLHAKKILFDAIKSNLDSALSVIKGGLSAYAQKPEYAKHLNRMIEYARAKLGSEIIIHCREEDKPFFNKERRAGVAIGSTIKSIGGIIAEDRNGTKEIDMTFEELLRTHEDEIKSFLLERMIN